MKSQGCIGLHKSNPLYETCEAFNYHFYAQMAKHYKSLSLKPSTSKISPLSVSLANVYKIDG